MTGYFKPFNW